MSVLYYLGIMQKAIIAMSRFMRWTIGTSGAETLSCSANIFVGQTEAPLLIKPFLDQKVVQQLIDISAGWYRIEERNGKLLFWDLRFGQMGVDVDKASFLWYYELNIDKNGIASAVKRQPEIKNMSGMFSKLIERIKGY